MTRLVVDANVLVSAAVAIPGSPSGRVVTAAANGAIDIVACERLLAEVQHGLERPYFASRLSEGERRSHVQLARDLALLLPDPVAAPPLLRDPRDDYLVALAIAAGAEAIVTGDRDLLDHGGLRPPAITPRTACERFRLA